MANVLPALRGTEGRALARALALFLVVKLFAVALGSGLGAAYQLEGSVICSPSTTYGTPAAPEHSSHSEAASCALACQASFFAVAPAAPPFAPEPATVALVGTIDAPSSIPPADILWRGKGPRGPPAVA